MSAAIADAASGIALALRGEGSPYILSELLPPGDGLTPAAVRVLGADVLAPYALNSRTEPGSEDASVVREALEGYPPGPGASDVSLWSYQGLTEAACAFLPGATPQDSPSAQPSVAWVETDPWPRLAHRASHLAALALPGVAPALAEGFTRRTTDLSRGFVRAVRRRDWQQAAGLGRWLAWLPDTPSSLGLRHGLAFIHGMSDGHARAALHIAAALRSTDDRA
ncbi:hypothetical protein ACFC09_32940 [Streptomyces sp. NPDC056161]|uniref:hypothetical protein n=1 Tax=Streptomyces sp. NPDC056161 TaxID=3345732 RepID=UPI0035D8B487